MLRWLVDFLQLISNGTFFLGMGPVGDVYSPANNQFLRDQTHWSILSKAYLASSLFVYVKDAIYTRPV